jgi:hypothetical protein
MKPSAKTAPRHAVYFVPELTHPLWSAGCTWLGRAADGSAATAASRPETATPWRYGWHATLKAPMRLASGVSEAHWLEAVAEVAVQHTPFALPLLAVAILGDFLALRPVQPLPAAHQMRRLADDCVLQLDRCRAPFAADNLARLQEAEHDLRRRANVARNGYAHVLDDWRFHMTLTGSLAGLSAEGADALCATAERHFAAALHVPLRCDALCLFVEPAPGEPFELRHRVGLRLP